MGASCCTNTITPMLRVMTFCPFAAFGHSNRNVDFGNGEMKMRLQGTTGSRLTTNDKDQLYGQWQVTAKVSGAPGAVTAFYARYAFKGLYRA